MDFRRSLWLTGFRLALLISLLAIAAIPATSFAATAPGADELDEYAFLGLVPTERVQNFRLDGFNSVDNYSVIMWGTQRRTYLFILARRCSLLNSTELITLTSTGSAVQAGFDHIRVVADGLTIPCTITRIYTMSGRGEVKRVRKEVREYHKRRRAEERERKEAEAAAKG